MNQRLFANSALTQQFRLAFRDNPHLSLHLTVSAALLSLAIAVVAFLSGRFTKRDCFMMGLLFAVGAPLISSDYSSLPMELLVLFIGIMSFYVVRMLPINGSRVFRLTFVYVLGVLALISLSWPGKNPHYLYRGEPRLYGIWHNPNTCGAVMAITFVSAMGSLLEMLQLSDEKTRPRLRGLKSQAIFGIHITALLSSLLALGLTYSRAAWLAAFLGTIVLFRAPGLISKRLVPIVSSVVIMALSALIVIFSLSYAGKYAPLRRVISISNPADLSWRNRMTTWIGALTMIEERPWKGWGWGRAVPIYSHFYQPPAIMDNASITLNDYLILAASSGVPALLCFFYFVSVSLNPTTAVVADWCFNQRRATTSVFLTVFMFDGGLFEPTLAIPFWALLAMLTSPDKHNLTGSATSVMTPSSKPLIPTQESDIILDVPVHSSVSMARRSMTLPHKLSLTITNVRSSAAKWSEGRPSGRRRTSLPFRRFTFFLMRRFCLNARGYLQAIMVHAALLSASLTILGEDAPAVSAFKEYLAGPPCLSHIVYSEIACVGSKTNRHFVGAVCGKDYFFRQLIGGENLDAPISNRNRNSSPLYTGRFGDIRWQIAGYQLTESIDPDRGKPDPYALMADGTRITLDGILTLGSQHIQPGSVVWSNDTFTAEPSVLARQFGVTNHFKGSIAIEDGHVTQMKVYGSGHFAYTYRSATNLLFGFPTEISWLDGKSNCVRKVKMEHVLQGSATNLVGLFDPLEHIKTDILMLSLWSNSVQILKPQQNEEVVQLVRKEFEGLATNKTHGLKPVHKFILAGAGLTLLAVYFMTRKNGRGQ